LFAVSLLALPVRSSVCVYQIRRSRASTARQIAWLPRIAWLASTCWGVHTGRDLHLNRLLSRSVLMAQSDLRFARWWLWRMPSSWI
jgi:hypothetical protein